MSTLRIALVGIGGYGNFYVKELLDHAAEQDVKWVAAIDPDPRRCSRLKELEARGVPRFASLDEFHARGEGADLTVIATGIHLHVPMAQAALARGSHVLAEKPMCATIQEALELQAAREAAGKFVAIGYQWSYSHAIQAFKRDVRSGRFGAPVRLKCLVLWPRKHDYYARNRWAGRLKTDAGAWVLDSPANNATAHYLHNMFYCLGDAPDSSALPVRAQAELGRANAIENFDTAAARFAASSGAEVLYFGSHAVKQSVGPLFEYKFEDGTAALGMEGPTLRASFADGTVHDYGDPNAEQGRKLWLSVEAARGRQAVLCPVEAAMAQTLAVNGMQDSMPGIAPFPAELVNLDESDGKLTWVTGLGEALQEAYRQNRLPSEVCAGGAPTGRTVDLTDYRTYPGGK
ncbi:MAG: Gfo/Idh/MocA family oxidoreductase [Planctomycetota bacterium]|nr:Gfo/Idh/MocA family oxidoreductase [Planctomycetota bacterium]